MEKKIIKILLIEDNPDDAELMKRRLYKSADARFAVTVSRTLRDGLDQLHANGHDLIICDLGLPDSHGLDTVNRILTEAPHAPLVVLSGFDDEATAIKAVQAGAQDYLVKGQLEGVYMERSLFYAIERSRLQRELERHSREILSIQANLLKILEKNADAIVVVGADKRILFTNPAVETLLGLAQKELINQSFKYPLDGGSSAEIEINRPDKAKTIAEMRVVDITWEGKPAYLASLRNITERKKAEDACRESEEKFSKAFRSSPEVIVISRLSDSTFMEVNDTFLHLTGYNREEVLGKKSTEVGIWANPEERAGMVKTLKEEGTIRNKEYSFRMKSQEIRTWLFSAEIANINKEPCILSVTTDITERKKAEEKLRKIDQMKSELLSNVSHELRTPLQSISGFTKLIMNGQVPDAATQQEFLQIIDREAQHLGNLINGLLDMSRLESGRFQINKKLMPVRESFADPMKSFHSLAHDKNITLSEEIPGQLPEMEVDGDRLRQVVINLLGNAIKFSDPGGSVAVKVEKQKDQLLFQVSDHGIGISEEAKTHLFERFFRAEGEMVRGGTGLGLYISKQIIEAHGGRIWADSKFGEGSTFSFTLPLNGKGGNDNGKENPGH